MQKYEERKKKERKYVLFRNRKPKLTKKKDKNSKIKKNKKAQQKQYKHGK